MRLPPRPAREPILTFNRRSDGELVEVWVTTHTQRSHDRQVDGRVYHRTLVAIGGHVHDHLPTRHDTPDAALTTVRHLFGME